jgi:hypothetical protein
MIGKHLYTVSVTATVIVGIAAALPSPLWGSGALGRYRGGTCYQAECQVISNCPTDCNPPSAYHCTTKNATQDQQCTVYGEGSNLPCGNNHPACSAVHEQMGDDCAS